MVAIFPAMQLPDYLPNNNFTVQFVGSLGRFYWPDALGLPHQFETIL
ncbi:MAG: hypothetical protein IT423_19955 [Pirellulaceae bacterium]|nr:hypothetical protein [Pirellulaceae bacterium]